MKRIIVVIAIALYLLAPTYSQYSTSSDTYFIQELVMDKGREAVFNHQSVPHNLIISEKNPAILVGTGCLILGSASLYLGISSWNQFLNSGQINVQVSSFLMTIIWASCSASLYLKGIVLTAHGINKKIKESKRIAHYNISVKPLISINQIDHTFIPGLSASLRF